MFIISFFSYSFSQTISFEDALEQTLNNNNKIKSQKLEIEASNLDVKKSKVILLW